MVKWMMPCGSATQGALHCASSANDANKARHDGVFASSRDLSACRWMKKYENPGLRAHATLRNMFEHIQHRIDHEAGESAHAPFPLQAKVQPMNKAASPCSMLHAPASTRQTTMQSQGIPTQMTTVQAQLRLHRHTQDSRSEKQHRSTQGGEQRKGNPPARRRDENLVEASRRPQHSSDTPGKLKDNLPGHQATASPPQRQVYLRAHIGPAKVITFRIHGARIGQRHVQHLRDHIGWEPKVEKPALQRRDTVFLAFCVLLLFLDGEWSL